GSRGWSTVPITPRGTRSSSSTRRVSTTRQRSRREREVLHNGFNTLAGSPTESIQLKSRQLAAIAVILSLGVLPIAPGRVAAVSAFDSYLAAAFVPLSNGSGTYSYFSPVSFDLIVPGTLLRLIPQSVGGFASLISPTQLVAQASPFVTLSGQKAASGFSHSLTVGSIKLAAVASGTLQLLTLFGSSPSSIQPSKFANTSTIYVRSLDGLISSKDKATVSNSGANFSGSYSYTLTSTNKVKP